MHTPNRMLLGAVALASALAALSGCRDLFTDDLIALPDVTIDVTADINIDPTSGLGLGAACDASAAVPECRYGLRCVEAACAVVGDTPAGSPCITTAECDDGLYCAFTGLCEPAGAGAEGDGCSSPAECAAGLVCASTGLAGFCAQAGAGDLDAPCADSLDCLAGLTCGAEGACGPGSVTFGFRPWAGVSCATTADPGPARVYFEVPRADAAVTEFFRLPFPNDIRRDADGTLDLRGFPTPGPGLVGFDPVARVVDAAEARQDGFSTVPNITFRFSRAFDLASLWAEGIADPPPGEPTLYFIDITEGSPGFNTFPSFGYFMTDGGTRYICPRYVTVKPAWATPRPDR